MIREVFVYPRLLVCRCQDWSGRQRLQAISVGGRVLWHLDPAALPDPIVGLHASTEVLVARLRSGCECLLDPASGELSAPIFEALASRGRLPLIAVQEIGSSG